MDTQQRRVLYVDAGPRRSGESDHPIALDGIRAAGWKVVVAGDMAEADRLRRRMPLHVGLLHIGKVSLSQLEAGLALDGLRGMEWLAILSAERMKDGAVAALVGRRCFDFSTLPLDLDRLQILLGHAYGMAKIRSALKGGDSDERGAECEDRLLGTSAPMQEVMEIIGKIADVDSPVLITGETGTGKALAARTIHACSVRSTRPFRTVQCVALPETSGPSVSSDGESVFLQAIRGITPAGGTLFLDEVGDLTPNRQRALLHFLQQEGIRSSNAQGGAVTGNTRVIAATCRDLDKAVAEGAFRKDLYFRLNILNLAMPPLRDHLEDLMLLSRSFLARHTRDGRSVARTFSQRAIDRMMQHQWPGNVRELINRVQRAAVMAKNTVIEPDDLGFSASVGVYRPTTLAEVRTRAEKEAIRAALTETAFNISQAARVLDISRPSLYRLLSKHRIRKHASSPPGTAGEPKKRS